MKKGDLILLLWRIPLDFAAVVAAWFLAYAIRPYTDLLPWRQVYFPVEKLPLMAFFIPFVLWTALAFVILHALLGRYRFYESFEPVREFFRLGFSLFIWGMLIIAWYALVWNQNIFSRIVLFHTMIFSLILMFGGRVLLRIMQMAIWKYGKNRKRIILFGSNANIAIMKRVLSHNLQFQVVQTLEGEEFSANEMVSIEHTADELWRCDPQVSPTVAHCLEELCDREHLHFRFVPDQKNISYARLELSLLSGNTPLLYARPAAPTAWQLILKRLFDFVFSSGVLVVLSPMFFLFALVIKMDSSGPIFFKSTRIGRQGKAFTLWKFRSMVVNADEKKKELVQKSHRKDGPLFKIKNDPRITRFGKFLRRFSLDELPNFINVWKGDMSLTGPRPHLPEEVEKYKNWQKKILMMKPGVTGLAQISGRSDLPFTEEVRLDLFYIQNWSFWLDMKIMIKTVFVILQKDGAD